MGFHARTDFYTWYFSYIGKFGGLRGVKYFSERGVEPRFPWLDPERIVGVRDVPPVLADELVAAGLFRGSVEDPETVVCAGGLCFILSDFEGRVVGLLKRPWEQGKGPKYVSWVDAEARAAGPLVLGLHEAAKSYEEAGWPENRALVVTEGVFDALSAMEAWPECRAVALCGTAVGMAKLALLSRVSPTVILALDHDEAGVMATRKAFGMARSFSSEFRTVRWQRGQPKDLSDLLARDGAEAVRGLFRTALTTDNP